MSARPRWPSTLPAPGLHPAELQWKVLRDEVIRVKQDDDVDLKFWEEKERALG